MQKREVQQVITPSPTQDGAGVQLRRSIATPTLDHLDPFFLFDHFGSENPDDYIAGFRVHVACPPLGFGRLASPSVECGV